MSWLEVETTAAPAAEPIDAADVKAHCRIDGTADTEVVTALIKTARASIEAISGTRLITQTVKLRRCDFRDELRLPIGPVQSISSITYLDSDGVSQTLSASIYSAHLYGLSPMVRRKPEQSWPGLYDSPEAVTITAVVGYGDAAANLPDDVLHALRLLIAHYYENREPVNIGNITTDLPFGVVSLINRHRIFGF